LFKLRARGLMMMKRKQDIQYIKTKENVHAKLNSAFTIHF